MDKQEQIELVTSLANAIAQKIVADIQQGRVPTSWDGIELRQLLADRAYESTGHLDGKRKREYNNTVLVNNL